MFNSRKGVSEVIANVLIVLLVIIGIAVIWSVVRPTIDKSLEQLQADCFTVSVEPVSCSIVSGFATVKVKRNPGAGVFSSIEILFSDGTDSGTVTSGITTLNELSTASTMPPELPLPAGVDGEVTANTVLKVNGQLCQVNSQPITCT
ncbi:hypothetical protein FJZ21_02105 [Candidatus Pacearchaeota archaeon]|nr:hypothetical protein [Candidatus Pacearchaeota archaeon]